MVCHCMQVPQGYPGVQLQRGSCRPEACGWHPQRLGHHLCGAEPEPDWRPQQCPAGRAVSPGCPSQDEDQRMGSAQGAEGAAHYQGMVLPLMHPAKSFVLLAGAQLEHECYSRHKPWLASSVAQWYAMLCHAVLCHAVLCYAMLCFAMLCHAIPSPANTRGCHALLCYAMLCYILQHGISRCLHCMCPPLAW